MFRLRLLIFFPIALFLVSLGACNDDFENYSTNPGDTLSFSVDTLSFDTILSTVGTPTLGFMVYNRNPQPLLISSIHLASGSESEFRINVDGASGMSFNDVEVGAKDSIYVFVEALLKENSQKLPVLHSDQVVFVTNSVQQKVVLEAYGQDVYIWKGKIIETSEILPNDKPYLIYDSLEIRKDATLTLQEGTVFYMHSKAKIKVFGTLKAKGTEENRIVFRGDRMDSDRLIYISYDLIPGQWDGLFFGATSFDNELDYVWIRNGSYGLDFEISDPVQSKLKISNSIVTNVSGPLITALNCRIEGDNCEFSNSRNALMYLAGGKYTFTHCTLANYYANIGQWGRSDNPTLTLTNKYYKWDEATKKNIPQPLPLEQADFSNCIVYGANPQSGINLAKDTTDFTGTIYNYHFQNCLVLYDGTSRTSFVNCKFNEDPVFVNTQLIDDDLKKTYPYDFRLDSISPARNVADPEIARLYPYDINGISRFQDEGPDMGAYEYVKNK